MLAAIHYPGKTFRNLQLPFAPGRAFGSAVSVLNLVHPLTDPSLYALYSVSRNLDFSNDRFLQWMHSAGRRLMTR